MAEGPWSCSMSSGPRPGRKSSTESRCRRSAADRADRVGEPYDGGGGTPPCRRGRVSRRLHRAPHGRGVVLYELLIGRLHHNRRTFGPGSAAMPVRRWMLSAWRSRRMLYLPHPMTAEMKLPTRSSAVPQLFIQDTVVRLRSCLKCRSSRNLSSSLVRISDPLKNAS